MNNLENQIKNYFNEEDIEDLSSATKERLKSMVKLNKQRKNIGFVKRFATIACSFCLILLIMLPTVYFLTKDNSNTPTPPTIYYANDETIKQDISIETAQSYIANNFPKYNFMFEEFSFTKTTAFYNPDNNTILALQIKASEKNAPFTLMEINLIASKQFVFDLDNNYIENASHIKNENYEIYKKENNNPFNQFMLANIKFSNHQIYLNFDLINNDLLNKFI